MFHSCTQSHALLLWMNWGLFVCVFTYVFLARGSFACFVVAFVGFLCIFYRLVWAWLPLASAVNYTEWRLRNRLLCAFSYLLVYVSCGTLRCAHLFIANRLWLTVISYDAITCILYWIWHFSNFIPYWTMFCVSVTSNGTGTVTV